MKAHIDTTFTTVTENGEETRVPDLGGYETDSDVRYSVMDRGDGTLVARVTAPATTMSNITGASATTELTDADAQTALDAHRPGATLENLDQPDIEVDQELNAFAVSDVLDAEEQDRVAIVLTARRQIDRSTLQDLMQAHGAQSVEELATVVSTADADRIVTDHGLSIPNHVDTATAGRAAVAVQTVGGTVLQDQELTAMNKVAKAKGLTDAANLSKNTRSDNAGDMGQFTLDLLEGKQSAHGQMLDYIKGNAASPWPSTENPPAVGSP